MAYCNQDGILKMIPQDELTELTADTGDTPDPEVVTEAIAKADAEIDAYLGTRYVTPLSPVPAQVTSLSVDMAIYHLYTRRSLAPMVRRRKYEAALAFLQRVASGEVVLEDVGGEPPGTQHQGVKADGATRLFSRDTLGDW
jgi:phage gp36-like protein